MLEESKVFEWTTCAYVKEKAPVHAVGAYKLVATGIA